MIILWTILYNDVIVFRLRTMQIFLSLPQSLARHLAADRSAYDFTPGVTPTSRDVMDLLNSCDGKSLKAVFREVDMSAAKHVSNLSPRII
jgi:hypothetical protein